MILLTIPLSFIVLLIAFKTNENYLLKTGRFRLFFSWFFRVAYRKQIKEMKAFYFDWYDLLASVGLTELEPFNAFDIFYAFAVNKWDFEKFQKIVLVCLYANELPTKATEKLIDDSFQHINLKTA